MVVSSLALSAAAALRAPQKVLAEKALEAAPLVATSVVGSVGEGRSWLVDPVAGALQHLDDLRWGPLSDNGPAAMSSSGEIRAEFDTFKSASRAAKLVWEREARRADFERRKLMDIAAELIRDGKVKL